MNPTEIGVLVRRLRKSQGLTLEDLAFRVGVTSGALSHIENGRRLPSPQVTVALAEALGYPAEEALQALDAAHGDRRRESLEEKSRSYPAPSMSMAPPMSAPPSSSAAPSAPASFLRRVFEKRDVAELFDEPVSMSRAASFSMPDVPAPQRDVTPMRDAARWSPDTDERLRALENLADVAADSIRTLRGMLDDEDPAIRREAKRLLRELDVRVTEE